MKKKERRSKRSAASEKAKTGARQARARAPFAKTAGKHLASTGHAPMRTAPLNAPPLPLSATRSLFSISAQPLLFLLLFFFSPSEAVLARDAENASVSVNLGQRREAAPKRARGSEETIQLRLRDTDFSKRRNSRNMHDAAATSFDEEKGLYRSLAIIARRVLYRFPANTDWPAVSGTMALKTPSQPSCTRPK